MSLTAKLKTRNPALRIPIITIFLTTALLVAAEEGSRAYFRRAAEFYSILPELKQPFENEAKTLTLKSSHPFWNGHFLNPTKKLRKIKKGEEPGLVEGTIVLYHRYENFDLQIPAIMTIDWYKNEALRRNVLLEFRDSFVKKITRKMSGSGEQGKSLSIVKTQIGETDVELNINGNISITGQLVLENKDLVTTNLRESKSWDLEVEQTQRFNIDGTIGDRWTLHIKQDSEADFSWENDLTIEYKGKKNDIFQKAEAGNINLSLEGMDAVNLGGANSSLFGVKMVHQLGPVEIQSVMAMEQVKKAEKTMEGGEITSEHTVKDYDFIVDRYFYIEEYWRNQHYPLNAVKYHSYSPDYVVKDYELFRFITNAENDVIYATAFIKPHDETSDKLAGSWVRMEERVDYEISRLSGYVRLNNNNSAIAIAYTIGDYNPDTQEFSFKDSTGTNFKEEYSECISAPPASDPTCENAVHLKLLKYQTTSTPNSATWPLMFKNVYSLGASQIDPSGLEVEILLDLGANDFRTHTDNGDSYLSIFGMDSEDENRQPVDGGDGKIDIFDHSPFVNLYYGELVFPAFMPFGVDDAPRVGDGIPEAPASYWGYNNGELAAIFNTPLHDVDGDFSDSDDSGPAMYYTVNDNDISAEHEFIIKIKHSSKSSSLSLGFMIVEGSETVSMGGQILQKDIDYTIDYFSGTINFINPSALDPTAEITVSYEENELVSFDQKILVGTHMKYSFGNNNFLAGGLFFYNQKIAEQKVDVGYEPMQNFVWNLKGKYQDEFAMLTRMVDRLPLIETTSPSKFTFEGSFAEVHPNPNPLGQAFIDDFESAKRTSSMNILQRQWKMASQPDIKNYSITSGSLHRFSNQNSIIDSVNRFNKLNRGIMNWYNPYVDIDTKEIWPNQSTSQRANNNTTKTLWLETNFQYRDFENNEWAEVYGDVQWNGIMIPLYASEYDQSLSKYVDIWLNAESVLEDSLKLHIDLGRISEDRNDNGKLDTEDEEVYGPGIGDNIFGEGEDIGVDGCTNSYEDGWGGCLCEFYDPAIYDTDLAGIYAHPTEYCVVDSSTLTYAEAITFDPPLANPFIPNVNDPSSDTWCYNTSGCNDKSDYRKINGTEGNGQAMGYRYPDTEDLDRNSTLDYQNDYYSVGIYPTQTKNDTGSFVETETTDASNNPTGWKLFRIPLSAFKAMGDPTWTEVRTMRLWVEAPVGNTDVNDVLKIAKVELVENEWQEEGIASIYDIASFTSNPLFSVAVINTDENPEYEPPAGVVREYDEYTETEQKEQSLVLSFLKNPNEGAGGDTLGSGGIDSSSVAAIKKTIDLLSGDKKDSYFAYEKMEMFVFGGDPGADTLCDWCLDESSIVDLLFRIGKDNNNYYEIRQPIYEGWDGKNHVNLNIDKLTQFKIPTLENPGEILADFGLDGFPDEYENGCGEGNLGLPYFSILDSLGFFEDDDTTAFAIENFMMDEGDILTVCGEYYWTDNCPDCSYDDPNGDNFDCGIDELCPCDYGYLGPDEGETNLEDEKYDGDSCFNYNDDGEAEMAIVDYDGNGYYSNLPEYDESNNLFFWERDSSNIHQVCGFCSELRIKGAPSINNIQSVMVGVVNNSDGIIYGKILIDELRMTGVKKEVGRQFSISASLNFADLMSISGSYNRKDADFHKLQQRLGTGSSDEYYSATFNFNPHIMLPTRWGVKTPVTLTYSNSVSTPKYHPGSDILSNPSDTSFNIEEIQAINEKISLSTSFSKTTRSTNWLAKRTIDNVSVNFSAIKKNKSSNTIHSEEELNFETSSSYAYSFGKENYVSPFGFMKGWFILGGFLGEARYYYTPEKLSAIIKFNENDKVSTQRSSLNETNTYSFNLIRKFTLNHKFTKSFSSTFTKQIDSNLDNMRSRKWDIIKEMNPGLVKNISEKFTNSYAPDFLKWLKPTITYNPTYTWSLNIIDTLYTANIKSNNTFKTTFSLSLKEMIELIYAPESQGKSSRSRGRGRGRSSSSSSSSKKKFEIKNPFLKSVFGKVHTVVSKLNKISFTYTYNNSHSYNNVNANISPSYLYRFGLSRSPGNLSYVSSESGLVGSFAADYSNDLNVSTSLNITRNIVTSVEYRYKRTTVKQSTSPLTQNESYSYYPLGIRGNDGLPILNWNVNWSGIEKWWILEKLFKSVSLSHSFHGEYSVSFKDGVRQNWDYTSSYSPLIGITTKTKGRSPITFRINYNQSRDIRNSGTSTERTHNGNISSSISYRKTGGLTIPLFFFRDFYIANDTDFNVNFSFDNSRKLMSSTVVDDLEQFNEQSNNLNWSVKPNVTYSFTRWVNGNFYFVYGVSETKTTGRNEEKDFGFTVNIKIQG